MNAHKLINEKVVIDMAYKKKAELEAELAEALARIEELEEKLQELKAYQNNVQKIKNERGAGRKSKFGNEEMATMTMLKLQGKSIRAIAKEMNCSTGLVHKLLNEPVREKK